MTNDRLLMLLGYGVGYCLMGTPSPFNLRQTTLFVNRLNAGNPNWTPYQVPEEK